MHYLQKRWSIFKGSEENIIYRGTEFLTVFTTAVNIAMLFDKPKEMNEYIKSYYSEYLLQLFRNYSVLPLKKLRKSFSSLLKPYKSSNHLKRDVLKPFVSLVSIGISISDFLRQIFLLPKVLIGEMLFIPLTLFLVIGSVASEIYTTIYKAIHSKTRNAKLISLIVTPFAMIGAVLLGALGIAVSVPVAFFGFAVNFVVTALFYLSAILLDFFQLAMTPIYWLAIPFRYIATMKSHDESINKNEKMELLATELKNDADLKKPEVTENNLTKVMELLRKYEKRLIQNRYDQKEEVTIKKGYLKTEITFKNTGTVIHNRLNFNDDEITFKTRHSNNEITCFRLFDALSSKKCNKLTINGSEREINDGIISKEAIHNETLFLQEIETIVTMLSPKP